uniref:phenylalanine--tRNA ligase n=1 Tax=Aceria tosichella TaxID=561515 RepID=A0A6G1SND7_9ACAR
MVSRIAKNFIEVLGKQYNIDTWTNITPKILELSTRKIYCQQNNPLHLVSERIRHFFKENEHQDIGYKYNEFTYPLPVVTAEDNFDSLLIAKDHVSRAKSDTYYVNAKHLFRSHTSAHQSHCLEKESKAFIVIADCFRRDEIDRTHFPVFHQCEIFKLYNHKETLGPHASIDQLYDSSKIESSTKQGVYTQEASSYAEKKLKDSIEKFVKDFFNNHDLETRWVSAYFPFTHPSFELEILWKNKWIEVLGCGIVRDEILKNANIRDHIGFAAGFGLERFAMLKYDIPDIRLFWTRDTGFVHQFENKSPFDTIKFKQFSSCPQCINDISFWLPNDQQEDSPYTPNDFYDLCRTIGGDLVEQVKLVDEFTHPKTQKKSHCYRIIYRAADRVLTKDEVNEVHKQIADTCKEQFQVQLR